MPITGKTQKKLKPFRVKMNYIYTKNIIYEKIIYHSR